MSENHTENSELENLSKSQLIQIINELQNTQAINKPNLSANGTNEARKRTENEPVLVDLGTSSSSEASGKVHIELADESTDRAKDKLKSNGQPMLATIFNAARKWMVNIGKHDKKD